MTKDVIFISHSSSDNEFAKKLAKDLKGRGVDVWIDIFDILPGSDWNASIQDGLTRSTFCLVVWSKSSVSSPEVLSEVFQAKAEGKQFVQVFLEDCKRPSQFDRYQNIDFRYDYDEALESLFSFLPITRRKRRLEEFRKLLPHNPYPIVPHLL